MRVFEALRNRQIALLWSALVLSAIGDELYGIALVWLAAETLGYMAGYVVALQIAVALAVGITCGGLADGRNPQRTMIASDLTRAAAVLLPPVWYYASGETPPIPVVAISIVILASARPFFDPTLQSVLPKLSQSPENLQAINGLFDAMRRIARIIGPSCAALLLPLIALMDFFTINAFTFLFSAWAVSLLRGLRPSAQSSDSATPSTRISTSLLDGFHMLSRSHVLRFHLIGLGLQSGAWYLGLIVAVALRIKSNNPDDLSAFGLVVATYGLGNVAANLVVTEVKARTTLISIGRIVSGVGFLGIALLPSTSGMMLSAALAAIGAPLTQVPLTTRIQTFYSPSELRPVFRIGLYSEWAFTLLFLISSPAVLLAISPTGAILLTAVIYGVLGVVGLLAFNSVPDEYVRFGTDKSRERSIGD